MDANRVGRSAALRWGMGCAEAKRCRQIGNSSLFRRAYVMKLAGERVRRTKLIRTDRYVVAVEVELVIPPDDPSEPCFEAETIQLLREVKERAERGDVEWLAQHGKVYEAMDAA